MYICNNCNKTFTDNEITFEKQLSNFHIVGIKTGDSIPKCPHCGNLFFFGLEKLAVEKTN